MNKMTVKELEEKYLNKTIYIDSMEGESNYQNVSGRVTYIDSMGQLHGTWGGLAVIPELDKFHLFDNELFMEKL